MKWSTFFNLLFGIIILSAIFYTCEQDKQKKRLEENNKQLTYQLDSAYTVMTRNAIELKVKDIQVTESQEQMKKLREELFQTTDKYNKKVKEVKALIIELGKVQIDTQFVPYTDTVKFKKWNDSIMANCRSVVQYYEDSTVLVGTKSSKTTEWYSITATIQKDGILIDSLLLPDSQYISITEFKGGFFKKNTKGKRKFYEPRKTKIEIKHTNPYFKTTGLDGFFFKKKPTKTYGNDLIHGAIAGGLLTILLFLSP